MIVEEKTIYTIEHPVLYCPYCAARGAEIYKTLRYNNLETQVLTIRYYNCVACLTSFKTKDVVERAKME